MPEQWQLTLEVIKSKAQSLMVENNGLKVECRRLTDQLEKLQQSVFLQQNRNVQLARFLKERNGRTDQQLRTEELKKIIVNKRHDARDADERFRSLNAKETDLERKVQQLKYTISEIELHQQTGQQKAQAPKDRGKPQDEDQLGPWRKQLEDENKQEVLLDNELQALKDASQTKGSDIGTIDQQNEELEARVDALRLQKLQHIKKSPDTTEAQANARKYDQLKARKEELEVNINAYEFRLEQLRESSLMAMSWPLKRKKLIHEMVQTDARNNQMRDKIKVLREDINILRDQVAKMERRLNFARGRVAQQ